MEQHSALSTNPTIEIVVKEFIDDHVEILLQEFVLCNEDAFIEFFEETGKRIAEGYKESPNPRYDADNYSDEVIKAWKDGEVAKLFAPEWSKEASSKVATKIAQEILDQMEHRTFEYIINDF